MTEQTKRMAVQRYPEKTLRKQTMPVVAQNFLIKKKLYFSLNPVRRILRCNMQHRTLRDWKTITNSFQKKL